MGHGNFLRSPTKKISFMENYDNTVSNEVLLLENRCKLLSKEVDEISHDFAEINLDNDTIRREMARMKSRSVEYEHGTFIALVVGPAKSGKSTLVNLIAGAYVSPTHFLECTVRPSIISKRWEDKESEITCYTSNGKSDIIDKIDSIIDCVRGLDSESNLKDISIETYPLTKENIRDKVELRLEDSISSDTLVTSITTPGGNLLQKDVFIVDMPGFDGTYKNIEDPTYDVIAQRADLIIFVQSSNAAFSKVSKDFLALLNRNNKDVPVCLIHNQFDATWWKSKEEKGKVTDAQRKFAIEEIRKSGFNIKEENSYTLNLGAIQDYRTGNYADNEVMEEENKKFAIAEGELYGRIINRRDVIRMRNCINRTSQQAGKLVGLLDGEIAHMNTTAKEYLRIKELFYKTDGVYKSIVSTKANADLAIQFFSQYEHQELGVYYNDNISYKNDDASKRIADFVERINNDFNGKLSEILNASLIENTLYNDFVSKVASLRETLMTSLITPIPEIPLDKINVGFDGSVDLRRLIDLKTIIPFKRTRIGLSMFCSHKAKEMRDYVTVIVNRLVYMTDHTGQPTYLGYVLKDVLPYLETALENRVEEIKREYQSRITDYLTNVRNDKLNSVIQDYESHSATLESLKSLTEKVRNNIPKQ